MAAYTFTALAGDDLVRAEAGVPRSEGAGCILAVIDKVSGPLRLLQALADRLARLHVAGEVVSEVGHAVTPLKATAFDGHPLLELGLVRVQYGLADVGW